MISVGDIQDTPPIFQNLPYKQTIEENIQIVTFYKFGFLIFTLSKILENYNTLKKIN